jgi:hypothetical protein
MSGEHASAVVRADPGAIGRCGIPREVSLANRSPRGLERNRICESRKFVSNRVRPVTVTEECTELPVAIGFDIGEITPKTEEALNLMQVQSHSDVYDTA